MNPEHIDRNTKASQNGRFCEEFAKQVLPGLEWIGGLYDAVLNGSPIDIKGCEAWYNRYDYKYPSRKAGMITLDKDQDLELKQKNGGYFCIVHFGELIVKSFYVPAIKVPEHKQISWTTMQKLAEAV